MADELYLEYEYALRHAGCNMLDRLAVRAFADEEGLAELFEAAATNKTYAALLGSFEQPTEEEYQEWCGTH